MIQVAALSYMIPNWFTSIRAKVILCEERVVNLLDFDGKIFLKRIVIIRNLYCFLFLCFMNLM